MKLIRWTLPLISMFLSVQAFAQSDAQKSFDKLKTLSGSWEGHVTTVPRQAEIEGKLMQVSLRVTSMGNAIVHEATGGSHSSTRITTPKTGRS